MASTLYQFKADLQGLVDLENKLKSAKAELDKLSKGTDAYKAKAAQIGSLGKQFQGLKGSMGQATVATNKMATAGSKLANTFKSAAVAIASAFAVRAIVGGVRGAIKAFADFESQMSAVKAISGATNEEFERLENSAKTLGASTVFTARQVAELQEEFARLGFTSQEIRRAQKATLDLAAATGESLSGAAQTAGTVLRAFNLEAEQTQRVTDTMAQSFTNSALNLEKFRESMKFVAPVARATGFTIEETSALLMKLADNGLSGSIAGNALKNIFLRLGDANSKLSKKLGGVTQGLPGLISAMRQLKEESFGATEATDLLDKRSAPAFLALIENIEGLEDSVTILQEAEGATARMAAIRLDNLAGDMTLLKSAMEGLGIALSEEFDIGIRNTIFNFTRFIQDISKSETALKTLRFVINALVSVLGGLAAKFTVMGVLAFARNIRAGVTAMRAMTVATTQATGATNALRTAFARTPWGFVAQAVTTIGAALLTMGEEASEAEMKQRRLTQALDDDLVSLFKHNTASKERAELVRQLANDFPELTRLLDLERMSNQELIELQKVGAQLNLTNRDQEKKAAEATIRDLQEQMKPLTEIAQGYRDARKEAEQYGELGLQGWDAQFGAALRQAEANENVFRKQIDGQRRIIREITEGNLNILKSNETLNEFILDGESTLRRQLELEYLKRLAAFRDMSDAMQEKTLADAKLQEETLEAISQYNDLIAEGADGTTAQVKEAQGNAEIFFNTLSEPVQQRFKATKGSIQDINIELSVFRKFVSNLEAALRKSGSGFDDSALSGVILQKTKDNFKELQKILLDVTEDTLVKRQEKAKAELEIETKKYSDELRLMLTNEQNLLSLQDETNAEILSKTIKANRQKFDVLKNLSTEEYNQLVSGEVRFREDMIVMIGLMLEEERNKIEQNRDLIVEVDKKYHRELLRAQIEYQIESANTQRNFMDGRTRILLRGEKNIFKRINQFRENEKKEIAELVDAAKKEGDRRESNEFESLTQRHNMLVEMFMNGEITEKEYLKRSEKMNEQHSKAILNIRKRTQSEIDNLNANDQEGEVARFEESMQVVQDYYSRAFDAFSTFMNNRFEMEMFQINEERDIKSQALSDELEEKLVALEGNEQAQEDMRKFYDNLQRVNEQKRAEELRVIQKKQFQMQKANDIIMATINGAVAITKVAGQTGIGAIAAAPIMSALVAAQIAAIASQQFVGAKGGIVPGSEEKFADGGMVVGPSHAQGGVKFAVGGRVAELEGGEAVINKRSTKMFRAQLSAMNQAGGGVKFADGGIMPGVSNKLNDIGFGNMSLVMTALGEQVIGGINNQQVTVTESDITTTQNNVSITELTSNIF